MLSAISSKTGWSTLFTLFVSVFFGACLSFGDLSGGTLPQPDASAPTGFTIGGSVVGLDGASVTLLDNGADSLTLNTDGPFTFPARLADAASYAVTIATTPNGHICAIQNATGQIAGANVTNVTVSCPSKSSTLASLSLSTGPLSPLFSPAILSYDTNAAGLIFTPSTIVTATAASMGAKVSIDGQAEMTNTATATVAITTTPRAIPIVVTAPDGVTTATTTVTVHADQEQTDYLKASNTHGGREFGDSVALSSDGTTLAVGAAFESSAATGINNTRPGQEDTSQSAAGAVYVFTKSAGMWTQNAYVKASNARANSFFGAKLALSSDGNVLVVCAMGESSAATGVNNTVPGQGDTSAAYAGAAYVFTRTSGAWTQTAYLKASNSHANLRFGSSVGLSGDGTELAIGAILEASNATGIDGNQNDASVSSNGAVYLFSSSGTTWTQTHYVKDSAPGLGNRFGNALALSNDGNVLAVGAFDESSAATGVNNTSPGQNNSSALDAGAVYVFEKSGSTWAQTAYVKASNTRAGDQFGSSVALSSDGHRLAVASPNENSAATGIDNTSPGQGDISATHAGAVYLFVEIPGKWMQTDYIKASNARANGDFGVSLSFSGDGKRLIIGADGDSSGASGIDADQTNTSATNAGAAYVFGLQGTTWAQTAYLKASNTRAGGLFGSAVAFSMDGATVAVAARQESSAARGVNPTSPGPSDTSASAAGAVYLFQ